VPPASERRRQEARAEGFVPASPLVPATGALAAGAFAAWWTAPAAAARLTELARGAFGGAIDPLDAARGLASTVAHVALPIAVAAFAGGALAGVAQTRGLFALGAFRRPAREDDVALPLVGWGLAAALVLLAVAGARATLRGLAFAGSAADAASVVTAALRAFVVRALLVSAGAALADWAWRRLRWERALSMSRADVERERREEEGDPRLRAERRRRQREPPSPPKPPES
jgi:flagellar biosynthesis protein FlhB